MKLSTGIVIFQDFEILDVFGPIEMFGMYPETFEVRLVAETQGALASVQGPRCLADDSFDEAKKYDVILVPGGRGTRREVDNLQLLQWLRDQAATAKHITSVCTGSALLAKAGVLDNRRATSNKMNFEWVASQGPKVNWVYEARWVQDGNILTSSGVSAGMDMSLALIRCILGEKAANDAALWAEYGWHKDPEDDPFAGAWRKRQ